MSPLVMLGLWLLALLILALNVIANWPELVESWHRLRAWLGRPIRVRFKYPRFVRRLAIDRINAPVERKLEDALDDLGGVRLVRRVVPFSQRVH